MLGECVRGYKGELRHTFQDREPETPTPTRRIALYGSMVILGVNASYKRGTPVCVL